MVLLAELSWILPVGLPGGKVKGFPVEANWDVMVFNETM